jgi:hypothetical protein
LYVITDLFLYVRLFCIWVPFSWSCWVQHAVCAVQLFAVGSNNRMVFLVPCTFAFVMKRQYRVADAELDPVGVSQEHAAS